MNEQASQALAVAILAFIAGVAVGSAMKQHERDKADLQRQIWDVKGLVAPLLARKKEAVTDDVA